VDEELVLEGALDAVGVAEVVDRRAARGEAGSERLGDREGERVALRALQRPHRPQRVDPRAEDRLIGVDVPHARDVPLVEHEGLDRRAAAPKRNTRIPSSLPPSRGPAFPPNIQ